MTPSDWLDALLSLPKMYGAQVARDGSRVAWIWLDAGPSADVYVAPVDGSAPPTRLTDSAQDSWLVSWSPDSRSVIIAQDQDGDERAVLYRVDLDQPCQLVPLTPSSPNYYIHGGQLHPDGQTLIYGANVDPDTGLEIEPTCVYRQDLTSGARTLLARPEKGAYTVPMLSPDGRFVLYNRSDRHPAGDQLWLVGSDGSDDHEIITMGDERKASGSWFPDSQRILVLGETPTHTSVGIFTVATGSLDWLVDDARRNIERAYVPPGSNQIVLVEIREARYRASLLDPATGAEITFPDVPGDVLPLVPVNKGTWLASWSRSTQPTDLIHLAFTGNQAPSVSISQIRDRTSLSLSELASATDFRWQGHDGLEIQGWLYRPQQANGITIIYVHGGPTSHARDTVDTDIQYFVHCGFTVLAPNYRGSTGFSMAYREAIKVHGWGSDEQEDIRAGIEALIAQGIAQTGRVGITGTSYGGYSSWHAITHFPRSIIAAAAPVCGMTDLIVDYETTRPDLRPYSAEMLGGRPDEVPDRYRERSPINYLENIQGRLLIVQGARDPNVTPENVRLVRARLDALQIPYETLIFADEGHGIMKPANQKIMLERMGAFFSVMS